MSFVKYIRALLRGAGRSLVVMAAFVGLLAVALAYSEPGVAPTDGIVYLPVNTSENTQTKFGNLNVIGNVGIGTTLPNRSLEVRGSTPQIQIGDDGQSGRIDFYRHTGSVFGAVGFTGATSNGMELRMNSGGTTLDINAVSANSAITFSQGGGEKMRVHTNGNIGIGTTGPQAGLDVYNGIHIHGSARYATTGSGVELLKINDNLGTLSMINGPDRTERELRFYGTPVAIYQGGGEKMRVHTNGNIGIGTVSPTQKLDVEGYVRGSSGLCIVNDCRTKWPEGGGGGGDFWAANGSSIYNTNSGNVGIGTESPLEKLHIGGSIFVGGNWYKSGNLSSVNSAVSAWGAEGGVIAGFSNGRTVAIGQTGASTGLGITSGSSLLGSLYAGSTEVGIGTYTSGPNMVRIWAEQPAGFAVADIKIQKSGMINLRTQEQDRLVIGPSGNIGIGITNPSKKLEISGGDAKVGVFTIIGTNQYPYPSPGIGSSDGVNVAVVVPNGGQFYVIDSTGWKQNMQARDYWIGVSNKWVSSFSDARLKENIKPLADMLGKIGRIRGVSFEWNDAYDAMGQPDTVGRRHLGVIAQELETEFPELVTASGDDGYKVVNYEGLTSVLVEAVKELKAENATLKARIDALEAR